MEEQKNNISQPQKEALDIMENTTGISHKQLQAMEDEECLQTCSDLAELAIALQVEQNPLGIDAKEALADFHRKHPAGKRQKSKRRMLWASVSGIAATVAMILAVHLLMPSPDPKLESVQVFRADSAKRLITLQVEGEKQAQPLQEMMKSSSPVVAMQMPSSQEIDYQTIQSETKIENHRKVQRHRLSIPRGKTFKVVLSDGTEVFLNSDSRLAYPTVFKGKERVVSLEGEAYFNVTKDATRPFIVKSGGVQVRVLGTEFNVKGYADGNVCVTLVEGKVAVSDTCGLQAVEMIPGQSAQLTPNGTFDVEEVDTEAFLYWKEGLFYFDQVTLADMMKEIGRWYNIDIEFRNRTIMNLRMHFLAERQQDITALIELLNKMGKIHAHLEAGKLIIE